MNIISQSYSTKYFHLHISAALTNARSPCGPVITVETLVKGEFINSLRVSKIRLEFNAKSKVDVEQGRWEEEKEKSCLPFLPFWMEGDSLAAV